MNETQFWTLVDRSDEEAKGDYDRQTEILQETLEKLSPEEIHSFDFTWQDLMCKTYHWDLWAAAYIINGGCSDDGFEYFRCWLIGKGRKVFENALKDPESLVDIAEFEEAENEGIWYAARDAYEAVTGKELSLDDRASYPDKPLGESWEEKALSKKYPKLATKFGME